MIEQSILPHAELIKGENDHREDTTHFIKRNVVWYKLYRIIHIY